MTRWSLHRLSAVVLGLALWLVAGTVVVLAVQTVWRGATRNTRNFAIKPAQPATFLSPGDGVLIRRSGGLHRIGEVSAVSGDGREVTIAILPDEVAAIHAGTRATCWHTPLTAEEALTALFPADIQQSISERIAADYRLRRADLEAAWTPVARELLSAYFDHIEQDLKVALREREGKLWQVAESQADNIAGHWPAMLERLRPIVRAHLTPVLSRLLNDAIDDAPKARIAWSFVRGKNDDAFRRMLDWLNDYLTDLPDSDRAELRQAVDRALSAARHDEVLMQNLSTLGSHVMNDAELRSIISEVYRQAIADNPATVEFIRQEVLESPRVQKELYQVVDWFAPTGKRIAAMILFDDTGTTRPEVVHLVRSIALDRRIGWVTLDVPEHRLPMSEDASIPAVVRGGRRGIVP